MLLTVESEALTEWNGNSARRIEHLMHAHQQVGGSGSGRRWRTEQLNWSLVLLVASEFQRFSRSLHDLAVEHMATQTAQLNWPLGNTLQRVLTTNRQLDKGNATPTSLAEDFGRLGMRLWDEIKKDHPQARAEECRAKLEAMNYARNGIVHADLQKLRKSTAEGYPLTQLRTVRRFRSSATQLAGMMDMTVRRYLVEVLGGDAPW